MTHGSAANAHMKALRGKLSEAIRRNDPVSERSIMRELQGMQFSVPNMHASPEGTARSPCANHTHNRSARGGGN